MGGVLTPLSVWKRRLRPAFVTGELRRISRKLRRKLARPERRVAQLASRGEASGRALVSYVTDALFLRPGQPVPHSHTHFWESRQIGRVLADMGFEVDFIHWGNLEFQPAERYDVLIDVRLNLERLAPLLGEDCLRIQHIETGHYRFHNAAQLERLADLERRRGLEIRPQKLIEENRAIENAHYGIALGNEFTIGTYAHAGRPIRRVPISTPCVYPAPEGKDLEVCRGRYLWFGSGGLVHKGLDLVLEAFAGRPDLSLVVCGPIHMERDFESAYAKELYETPNIETVGWVDVAGEAFRRIAAGCLGVIYPSCSEGGGGGVITCMHAGLIPVVTRESSVDLGGFGLELEDASVDTIRRTVLDLSARPQEELRDRSEEAWQYARDHHTRESFDRGYRVALAEILSDWRERHRG